jgi:hypothetical protein
MGSVAVFLGRSTPAGNLKDVRFTLQKIKDEELKIAGLLSKSV